MKERKVRLSVPMTSSPPGATNLSKTDMTAGEIVQRFEGIMSQPAISKHLSVLENAGLLWRKTRGQNMHYGLREDALTGALAGFLGEVCPPSRPFAKRARRRPGVRRMIKPFEIALMFGLPGNLAAAPGAIEGTRAC